MFGPLSFDKINDPFDMTEAWEEYLIRAEVGKCLAEKDSDQDGIVQLEEHQNRSLTSSPSDDVDSGALRGNIPMPPVHAAQQAQPNGNTPADFGSFLEALGLGALAGKLAAEELYLEILLNISENELTANELLKDVGALAGQRARIITALRKRKGS